MASVAEKLNRFYQGAVRKGGRINPMAAMRQAADASKFTHAFMLDGAIRKDALTSTYEVVRDPNVTPPAEVFNVLQKLATRLGWSLEKTKREASVVLEGVRLNELHKVNVKEGYEVFQLHMNLPDIATQMASYNATPELQEISKLMDAARVGLVNHMERVGRLTPEMAKEWRDVVGYVPFDRMPDLADHFNKVKKPSGKGVGQFGKIPDLVGSKERPVGDVFENYVGTVGWLLRQVLITDATRSTLDELVRLRNAKFVGLRKPEGAKGIYQEAWINGEQNFYKLETKYDKMAFADPAPPPTGAVKVASQVSNILRTSVTALPPFSIKQVVEDIQRAINDSGVRNPAALIGMSLRNFADISITELKGRRHPLVAKFARKGITGEVDSNHEQAAKYLMQNMGVAKRSLVAELFHKLDVITRASDLAVRAAVHEQTLRETANSMYPAGDMLLADTRARELINFRRRGSSQVVGTMISTIPFFNAYAQGTDLMYRNALGIDSSMGMDKKTARAHFASRALMLFGFSLLYAMAKSDDEEYQNMALRKRNANWIVGGGIMIPMPGEYSALFKVTAENLVEYMRRSGTPEEMTANEAVTNAMGYIFETYGGRVVPVPLIVKPLLEAWTNYSSLTGRALEGQHQQGMDPYMRKAGDTSEFAIAIAKFTNDVTDGKVQVSPIKIDNTLNGYFGSSAALVKLITDSLVNPDRLDKPIEKWAVLSNFMYETGDSTGTRRKDEFYKLNERTSVAARTMNELSKYNVDEAIAYGKAHANEIALNKPVQHTLMTLSKLREAQNIYQSANGVQIEPDKEKREAMVKDLKAAELQSVQWVREVERMLDL